MSVRNILLNFAIKKVIQVKLNDGNFMPIIGLGTGGVDTKQKGMKGLRNNKESKLNSIRYAIDCGYRHFDSAFLYKTEKIIGNAANEVINDDIFEREEIFFVSKVWPTYYGKGRVIKSARQSIQESGLKYLDLLLLHMPIVLRDDDKEIIPKLPNGDIAFSDYNFVDVYKELEEVKRMGLAKSIGVSNFNSEQIDRVLKVAEFIPAINQVECHPYLNQRKLIKFCDERGIKITAFSPLGRRNLNYDKPAVLEDDTLKAIAKKYSKSVAQIVLRWQIQRGVVVIPSSSNKERISENINIFNFSLTCEDMSSINSLDRNLRYADPKLFRFDGHKEYPLKIDF